MKLAPVLYIPHGGGPLPLLGDPRHQCLVDFLGTIARQIARPSAILLISAHWEETLPTLTSGAAPDLVYDYYGFPAAAYEIAYPVGGDPALAQKTCGLLEANGIAAALDAQRGFDHGLFVPLKLMYPDAAIPCVQLSLCSSLDPEQHMAVGKSLASLRKHNVLIIGSGLSFHNMDMFSAPGEQGRRKSDAFDKWLVETCTDSRCPEQLRVQRLGDWSAAPAARFCHPREEHLLPLHVCYGAAAVQTPVASLVFNDAVLGHRVSGFLWQ